jgi:hypothetical protein
LELVGTPVTEAMEASRAMPVVRVKDNMIIVLILRMNAENEGQVDIEL